MPTPNRFHRNEPYSRRQKILSTALEDEIVVEPRQKSPSNWVVVNFLEQVATASEKAELLPALGAETATWEQWKRSIEIIIKRTVLSEPYIGGCLARLCPCCLAPTLARLAICISCHTTLFSTGRLYRRKRVEQPMSEKDKARERAEIEEIEKAAKEAETTATDDDEGDETDDAEGIVAPDVEKQADGNIPDYQAWAFEEDYAQRPLAGTSAEPEDAQLYVPARNLDSKPALGIYLDYVMLSAMRRVWKQAQEKLEMGEDELVKMWKAKGIRHDGIGPNFPKMTEDDILPNGLPRELVWDDFVRLRADYDKRYQHYYKYLGNKFCVELVQQAIRVGYDIEWFNSDKILYTEEGVQVRMPLQKVIRATTGCKYYAYSRNDAPVAGAFTVINMAHIIHGLSPNDVTTEFAKICLAHGVWLHPNLVEKGKKGAAVEDGRAQGNHPMRITAADYAP